MAGDNIVELIIKGDSSSAQKAFNGLEKSMGVVEKAAASLGLAFGAMEFAEFIKRQIEVADQFSKMSEKTGVAVDALSQLDHAFRLGDLSSQDMEQAFRYLNKAVTDAKEGNIGAMESFKSLGVSMADLKKDTPLDVLFKLADAYTQIQDPAARTTMLVEKFGRAGMQLAPVFAEGSEGIKKLMAEADRFGLTVDKEFGKAAEAFNDNLRRIGDMSAGAGRALARGLLPILNTTIETLFDFGKTGETSIVPWGKIVVTAVATVSAALIGLQTVAVTITDAIVTAFQATGQFIGSVMAAAAQAVEGDFSGALSTLEQGWNDMGAAAEGSAKRVDATLQRGADGINKLDEMLKKYNNDIKQTGAEIDKASGKKIDPVSQEAAARLDALRRKLEDFESSSVKATAAASGNKLAILDAEHAHQIQILDDLQKQGADTTNARLLIDQQYAAQRQAIQDEMLSKLGVSDDQYRERQLALAQQQADYMTQIGLSQAQADSYVNQTKLALQQQFLAAKQSAIDADWQTYQEKAIAQDEAEAIRLQLALENGYITKQQYDQLDIEREVKKQAALGSITAQAEANRLAVSKMSAMQQLQYTSNALSSITGLMSSESKTQFEIGKAAAIAQAVVATYTSAVNAYQSASAIPFAGWILGPIAAAAAIALGLQNVNKIRSTQFQGGQAHAGLTNVPAEGTYLLDKGERVLSPEQNKDLTSFMQGGEQGGGEQGGSGVSIGSLKIDITVPNGAALLAMTRRDWEDIVVDKVIPALNVLDRKGIRPDALQRYSK